MNKRKWIVLGLIVVGVLLFVILRPPPIVGKPRIGVILSTTGQYDLIGKPERDVLEALMKDYKAHDHVDPGVELVFSDSGGQLEQATKIFNDFAKDPSIKAIIGPSTSGESIPLAALAESKQIPLLSLAASRKIVVDDKENTRKWVFKFAQNDDLAARRVLQAMEANQHRSVALLYSDDGFGKSGGGQFLNVLKQAGIKPVFSSSFPSELTEPDPVIAGIPGDVKAVVIWGTAPGPALLVRALRRKNQHAQIYLSHGDASVDFLESAGPAAEGVIIVGSRVLLDRKYLNSNDPSDVVILSYQDFWTHHGFRGAPSHFGGHARDAIEALILIMAKGQNERADIRAQLETLDSFHGVTGTFRFNEKDHAGLDIQAFATYRVEQGAFVPFEAHK